MASRTIGRFHSVKAVRKAGYNPASFRPATVKEIFGPDFKPLMWVGKSAFVIKEVEAEAEAEASAA
jgi:hypothetical protein